MDTNNRFTRLLALAMALIMVLGMLPADAFHVHAAENEPIVVIAASDYQESDSSNTMRSIMKRIKQDYDTVYGALLGGDYDAGNTTTTAAHIEAVDDDIDAVFPGIASDKRIYIQGNHESFANLNPGSGNLMNETGAYDTDHYGVYAINHKDFPWSYGNPSEALVQKTAAALGEYLDGKVAQGYTKPIFVMSHLPLHDTSRGDSDYAKLIFDELEEAGEAGLNIIFLFGHNHSGGYDAYLGNGSIYLPVGSSLTVVDGSSGSYTDPSISFTYVNYGYVGYVKDTGGCTHLTMTTFEIADDQVIVKRYDASGLHKLKAAGAAVSGYNTDSTVIGTEGATIELGAPVPAVTLTDNDVTVTSAGLTGLSVTKVFGSEDTDSYDSETYGAYASYDIVPEGYTQGKTATVTIVLDEADGFDASRTVTVIDVEEGTEQRKSIENGAVTFTTDHFSTYQIAQRSASADYTYELVRSIEAGEKYVIVGNDDAVALMDASGSLGSQEVVISGELLTSETELTEWTFSSASSGSITSTDGRKLGYSSSSWNLTGSGDCSFDIGTGSGNFSLRVIRSSSGYNRYYFNYDGSGWTSKPTSAAYVRLYQLVSEGSGGNDPDVEVPESPETPDPDGGWVALPAGNTFELDTDGIDPGAKYLIVAKSYAKALSSAAASGNAVDVSISGSEATADADYGWTFTASGSGYLIQSGGTYLGRSSSSLAAGNSGSVWTVSNSGSGRYTITQAGSSNSWWGSSSSYYVRWSNSNGYFQASSSSTDPVRLYKYTGTGIGANYIRLSGETEQTYTIADAAVTDTVLGKVMIQTSDDGSSVNAETLAVTADMVNWDNAFDGRTAGTYTGTVVCEGCVLGTIVVTVRAEHQFETITVDATCTEDGSITTKCAICGEATVEIIEAKGHDYVCVVNDATCGSEGIKTYTCNVCGDQYAESIPATGNHVYDSVITLPTCTEGGYTTYTCVCSDSYSSDETAALGHSYEIVTVEPTCTEDGSVTYTCDCGDSYVEIIAAAGHAYEAVVTAPTCTEKGYTTYSCACGESYVSNYTEAKGHSYETKTVEPTCTEDGSVTYTCACGHSYSEVIKATGHSYESVVTAPTCTEKGYTTYTCACGDVYVSDETAALGHSYEAVVTAPTCTEGGYTTYICACGESYVGEVTEALGHRNTTVTVDPTCTEGGYTADTCTVCGYSVIYNETAALGHSYEAVVTAPTCTEAGCTTHTCAICGDSYVSDRTEALGHKNASVVTAPTCTAEGFTTHTCTVCGEVTVDTIVAALGHSYETVTVEPTCTEQGSVTSTCARCGDSSTELIEALGHDYKAVVTAPTCTEGGFTTYTCARCADNYTGNVTAALGHSHRAERIEPTCTEDGSITYTCFCGDSYSEIIAATGHSYEAVVTAPTCTEAGYTTYICACGDTYVSDEVAALGHSYEAVVTAPTCTEKGFTTYTCACGDIYVSDEVAALGHSYEAVVTAPTCTEKGFTTYTCACGDTYVSDEVAALGHSYETVTVEATCTENGSVTHTCACGDSYSQVIAAKGHAHEAVVTAPACTVAGYTTYTCGDCGDSYTADKTEALGHAYTTVEDDGQLIHTCGRCGDSYTESINWIAMGNVYVLDTDGIEIGEAHKYLVVGSDRDYALTLNGNTISASAVTVENDTIALDNGSACEFWFMDNGSRESGSYLLTQDGSKSVYHVSGNINYGHDSKGYWHIGSGSNGAYQLYDRDNANWYLNYGYVWANEGVSRFAVSSNSRTVRLFKSVDGYVRLAGDLNQTWTDADGATEAAVLEKVSIQRSTDGSTVSGTEAVTADMVTWDRAFDGTTAGVYTASVTCSGEVIGTITVNITSKHVYEITVVEPTCTEGGYTVRTCTECGVRYESAHTEALGHSYSCVESDGYLVYTCDRCGDSYSEKSVSYTQVSSIASGNRYVITLYSGSKYYALSHANNTLSAVQVTVVNGEITSEITDDLLWDYSGSKLSYTESGKTYYMYATSSGWWWWVSYSLSLSTSNSSTVSFSSSKLKIGSYYLTYSNGSASVNSSATTTYMFLED